MLFNRLLTADWLSEIKIERGGWSNKQIEEWNENTWNWNRFLCFSDDKWERKTLRQQRAREKERGRFFYCAWLNVHDHVRLMKKASKKSRKIWDKKPDWETEKLSLHTVSFIQRFPLALKAVWSLVFLVRGGLCSCLWHTSVEPSEKKISSKRKTLTKISRYFLLIFVQLILDGAFKWHISWHITTAARTAITSFWLHAPSRAFQLSLFTMHEPDPSQPSARQAFSFGGDELCVCLGLYLSVA